MRITIKKLAEMHGVSAKTVSKALNDEPNVSEGLRKSIKETAARYDYIPNILGRGLKGRFTKTVGVIVSDNTNPNAALHIKGLEEKASGSGYNILLCNSNESVVEEEKNIRLLLQRQVDGIILSPSAASGENNYKSIAMLQKFGIPYVLMNRTLPDGEHSFVKSNNIKGGYLAMKYLIEKGHQNIVHLTSALQTTTTEERIQGIRQALKESQIGQEVGIFYCKHATIESSYVAALEVLRKAHKFTAVFAFNDIIAFGVLKAAYDCRLRVPKDIAVIGYDDIPFSEIAIVPLTTIRQDSYQIGVIAMELMLDKVEGGTRTPRQILLEPSLVERETV